MANPWWILQCIHTHPGCTVRAGCVSSWRRPPESILRLSTVHAAVCWHPHHHPHLSHLRWMGPAWQDVTAGLCQSEPGVSAPPVLGPREFKIPLWSGSAEPQLPLSAPQGCATISKRGASHCLVLTFFFSFLHHPLVLPKFPFFGIKQQPAAEMPSAQPAPAPAAPARGWVLTRARLPVFPQAVCAFLIFT